MKITIDLNQSPALLLKDLTAAVRFALGASFYIEESEKSGNFTASELADPSINMPTAPLTPALPALTPVNALPPVVDTAGAQSSAAAPAVSGVDLDSQGYPYDSRIHSAGKTKIGDGTWKKKKGADPALVEQVNAQNKQLLGAPIPTNPPATIGANQAAALTASALPPLTAAALPSLPPVVTLPPVDAEIQVTDYPSLAQWIAQQTVKTGDVVMTHVNTGLTHYGLIDATGAPTLPAMAHRPDMVEPFYKWLKAMLGL